MTFKSFVPAVVVAALPLVASAALYTQNFDVDDTANWMVNKSTGINANDAGSSAEFFYDYSAAGIPSAPNSGGSTRGLRLRANMSGGIFSGLSVSPMGQSFSGDYQLRFDMWLNFNGPAPLGGNGSTHAMGAGLDSTGTVSQWAGGAHDTVWFSTTVDGGSAQDYRVYPKGVIAGDGSTLYTAAGPGNRNASHAHYSPLGGSTPPAAQTILFPNQTGASGAGVAAFDWKDVIIRKEAGRMMWFIDGLMIADVDLTGLAGDGSNIFFSHYDTNATSSTDPNAPAMLFTLVDNVRVDVPEPSAISLLGLGALALLRRKR